MVGDFTLVSRLGAGTGGQVHLARRGTDQKLYAIKEMHTTLHDARYIMREVNMIAMLESPFVLRYYDSFLHEDHCIVLVMEYASGGSLDKLLEQHAQASTPFAEEVVWRYCLQLLLALEAVHQHGLHRDVKPANLLLQGDTLKLGDFGISRLLRNELATTCVGSPRYMALGLACAAADRRILQRNR